MATLPVASNSLGSFRDGNGRGSVPGSACCNWRGSSAGSTATVAACIGLSLGLLDDWLGGSEPQAPERLGQRVRLSAGHWLGERAATDILVLARKGRAFRSLDTLIARQGGKHVLYGSTLVLAAAAEAWSASTRTPVADLVRDIVR
jgi:hypothetical protein